MPVIGRGTVRRGKTFAKGFWVSQTCDNSLAEFPSGVDPSWGNLVFFIDNVNSDNFVEAVITNLFAVVLKRIKFITPGRKEIDLSQFSEITSTADIRVRFEITAFI